MKIGSLFAGIGGFDLAARALGWRTAWYSEIEPYACRVMARHFPQAVNHGDITRINGREVEPVDILCGGFPCQDISLAGHGAGLDGARSGLWFHYARLIEEIRPRYVVAENVSALRSRGLDRVLGGLAALGYDAEWHCIPASYVGAPHRRDRIWIIAYRAANGGIVGNSGSQRLHSVLDGRGHTRSGEATPAGPVDTSHSGGGNNVAYGVGAGLEGHAWDGGTPQWQAPRGPIATSCLRGGEHAARRWASEPNVGRVAYGISSRVDRIRCLGNAVVPAIPHMLFRAIQAHEASLTAGLSHI